MRRPREVPLLIALVTDLTVLAGTPLESAQIAAAEAGFLLPLDLGSRGSAQVGGNLATNAGGNRVIRYGMARAQVLGLEAVLADGTVLSSLNKMLKNNAGFDLKQLFIGSEGTLGIITRVVFRLRTAPRSIATAFCALGDFDAVLALLRRAETDLGGPSHCLRGDVAGFLPLRQRPQDDGCATACARSSLLCADRASGRRCRERPGALPILPGSAKASSRRWTNWSSAAAPRACRRSSSAWRTAAA